jgi:hypothetical protein
MKRLFALTAIALSGCSERQQTFSFVAGQVLPATIIEVNSDKVLKANFRQLNISESMSNFEKLDAKTVNNLREHDCVLRADFSESGNRLVSQNISIVCGYASYSIDGSVLDTNRMTGLSKLNVGADVYLTVNKSN